jgi:hypothetical protein
MDEIVEIPIIYNFNGKINMSQTGPEKLSIANALLEPAIADLRFKAEQQKVHLDFWDMMNWMFVNFYWTMLANVGQVQPINYKPCRTNPLSRLMTVNFGDFKSYNSQYNILLNEDLYSRQSVYLTTTVLPLLNGTSPGIAKLSDTNRFSPETATFIRSYSCSIRHWKDPFGFIFSVFTTIWVFTFGPISVLLFFATLFETRKRTSGSSPGRLRILANYCLCNNHRNNIPLVNLNRDPQQEV